MIYIKNQQDILKIKEACEIWKKVRHILQKKTKPGMKTEQLDKIAAETIKKNGATPTFFSYKGFPGNICISVNEELIHGIGSQYELKKEDMVTFDVGVTYQKYVCDGAFTIVLDKKNEKNSSSYAGSSQAKNSTALLGYQKVSNAVLDLNCKMIKKYIMLYLVLGILYLLKLKNNYIRNFQNIERQIILL